MAARNPANLGQPKQLEKIDALKKRLVGTDRDDHWEEVLAKEQHVKMALLKRDLTKHKGMHLLLEWIAGRIRESNDLLVRAKTKDLSPSERDGLIEVRDFMMELVRFLDPAGAELRDIDRELDYQLESDGDDETIPADMLTTKEDPAEEGVE